MKSFRSVAMVGYYQTSSKTHNFKPSAWLCVSEDVSWIIWVKYIIDNRAYLFYHDVDYMYNITQIIHETSSETHNQAEGLKLCVLEDVW